MPRVLLPLLCFALPIDAAALSCMPWHVEDAYAEADASPDAYIVVTGTLLFSGDALPPQDLSGQTEVPPETRIDARLVGTWLGRGEATGPFDRRLTLVVECAGPWCPQLTPSADYLAFLRHTASGYVLTAGPCGGMAFASPDPELLDRLQTCLSGAGCTPPDR